MRKVGALRHSKNFEIERSVLERSARRPEEANGVFFKKRSPVQPTPDRGLHQKHLLVIKGLKWGTAITTRHVASYLIFRGIVASSVVIELAFHHIGIVLLRIRIQRLKHVVIPEVIRL